jgi:hypothetical protein
LNSQLEEKWPWIDGTHKMRDNFLDILRDSDLAFNPGGQNMTLGALCRELGEIEYAYIQSFKNFTQDFKYRNTEAGLDSSLARLKACFQQLDSEMNTVLEGISDEDAAKEIDRSGFKVKIPIQMDIYLQALLIFFGKATVFAKAMNKTVPSQIQEWIG